MQCSFSGRIYFILLLLVILAGSGYSASAQVDKSYYSEIQANVKAFISSLDQQQRKQALLSLDDSARTRWNNLPVGLRPRAGISIGKMTEPQRQILHRILSASLSSQGYLKATSIMHLDNLLMNYYDSLYYHKTINDTLYQFLQTLQWSHRNFYLAVFGDPDSKAWGFKLEGHHLSVNFSFINNGLAVTPFFIGTDPAEYPGTEYAGWRVLGQEEDLGIRLMESFNPAQQKKAIISTTVPQDIFTSAESGKRLLDYQGLKAADMTQRQKAILEYIIREFVFNMEYDKAVEEYQKIIKAGIDKIYFGWIGTVKEKDPHYFVLNGPGFLIEFDNQGFLGKANHIHAIWREKGNEYGEDLLRKHYLQEQHPKR